MQDLVKGQFEWHNTINANFHELDSGKANNSNLAELVGYGVVTGLEVLAQETPNMTVKVNSGIVYMSNGARVVFAGNDSVAISPADAENPRVDIVYINTDGTVGYIAGVPFTTPIAPNTPEGAFLLAKINVAVGAASITGDNIVDKRKMKDENAIGLRTDIDNHIIKKATQTELGHVKVDGTTITCSEDGTISANSFEMVKTFIVDNGQNLEIGDVVDVTPTGIKKHDFAIDNFTDNATIVNKIATYTTDVGGTIIKLNADTFALFRGVNIRICRFDSTSKRLSFGAEIALTTDTITANSYTLLENNFILIGGRNFNQSYKGQVGLIRIDVDNLNATFYGFTTLYSNNGENIQSAYLGNAKIAFSYVHYDNNSVLYTRIGTIDYINHTITLGNELYVGAKSNNAIIIPISTLKYLLVYKDNDVNLMYYRAVTVNELTVSVGSALSINDTLTSGSIQKGVKLNNNKIGIFLSNSTTEYMQLFSINGDSVTKLALLQLPFMESLSMYMHEKLVDNIIVISSNNLAIAMIFDDINNTVSVYKKTSASLTGLYGVLFIGLDYGLAIYILADHSVVWTILENRQEFDEIIGIAKHVATEGQNCNIATDLVAQNITGILQGHKYYLDNNSKLVEAKPYLLDNFLVGIGIDADTLLIRKEIVGGK